VDFLICLLISDSAIVNRKRSKMINYDLSLLQLWSWPHHHLNYNHNPKASLVTVLYHLYEEHIKPEHPLASVIKQRFG
jgi:hypothetical protein